MKNRYILFALCVASTLFAAEPAIEPYDNLVVKKITINVENQAPGESDDTQEILHKMQTKAGEKFDQEAFDKDLKTLSDEYDWVEPKIKVENHEAVIQLEVRKRPTITKFVVEGNSYKKKKLLKEGELKRGMKYNRENFYKSIHKIREFYVKKGYFDVDVSYTVDKEPRSDSATIVIKINEGKKGHINKILFEGFSPKEEKAVWDLIHVRKFNPLYSWATGDGVIKEGQFDTDVQAIVHYMQNEGYVDAHVSMDLDHLPDGKLALLIKLDKGEKYFINNITFSGNTIINTADLKKEISLQPGSVYSIDKIREAQEKLKELYTKDGYLNTNVDYISTLLPSSHEYDINFSVEESGQYRIGLVMLSGNHNTTKNVIYNNIDLVPGEVLDTTKIKSTQNRLRSTGYFKNVNVYPVKCDEHRINSHEYCDVMVEVNEAQTGNVSLYAGFSTTDRVFGGLDVTENNFNAMGLLDLITLRRPAFRGGGEYLQMKGQLGQRERSVGFSWLNPYFNDTLWRFGVDMEYKFTNEVSKSYKIHTLATGLSARYPITPYFTAGSKFRVKDSIIGISDDSPPLALDQRLNSGISTGFAVVTGYDSTDNALKPHRGIRSGFEAEFAGMIRNDETLNDFPFLKFAYLNSLYYPVWAKGTLKFRGDFKFIQPLMDGKPNQLPLSEKFFLGGENTVRGYAPGKVGPSYEPGEPTGGISSALVSVEYLQNIFRPLDAFVFFDSGAISGSAWSMGKIQMSTGAGIRIDIGRRLPFVLGVGFPINEKEKANIERFFFSMAGEF